MTPDILIVGGGIVGVACARALAQSGLQVTLLEADCIGSGATAAGMGHIISMDEPPAEAELTKYSSSLWSLLKTQLPVDVEYEQRGTLWIAEDEEELGFVATKAAAYGRMGIDTQKIDSARLQKLEPNLRPGLAGGLLVASDSVLYAPTAAAFLWEQARREGAKLIHGRAVAMQGGTGVQLENGEVLRGGLVVVATGALVAKLLPQIPVRPRKGHLVITDRYPRFVRHQLIELGYMKSAHGNSAESVAFNVQPRKTGQVLVGSSRQFGVESAGVEQHMVEKMMYRAAQFMPGLEKLSALRAWAGFRAASPDGLPILGPVPGIDRLLVATGHEGLGITTSLGSAILLRDHILRKPSTIPILPYLPSRFQEQRTAKNEAAKKDVAQ